MKVVRNIFTIADLNGWMNDLTLIVNKNYQRGVGLWPLNARTYFIDSILNGYPFPKITIRQTVDLKTKKSTREIIDGQQRMTSIRDFINNRMRLSKASEDFHGMNFDELELETQREFLAYEVSVDTVIAATEDEVLGIFRRMNSYTLPLNEAEKRHATYQGEFKWFIKEMMSSYSPLLEDYQILSTRQISRMDDADLITELAQVILEGVFTRGSKRLNAIYKSNEYSFQNKEDVHAKLIEVLDFIKVNLRDVCETGVLKGYSFYSIVSALIYNKWGIIDLGPDELSGIYTIEAFSGDPSVANQQLSELFSAIDQQDQEGPYGDFVKACSRTTHSISNRRTRLKWMAAALQGRLDFLLLQSIE